MYFVIFDIHLSYANLVHGEWRMGREGGKTLTQWLKLSFFRKFINSKPKSSDSKQQCPKYFDPIKINNVLTKTCIGKYQ